MSDSPATATEAATDRHEGLFPKYHVRRLDGRDAPGGDREDARRGYFVLDIVHDPIARQAYALYASLAAQKGYPALAADMSENLRIVESHVADRTDATTPIRMVATWTYQQAPGHAYCEQVGHDAAKALTAAEKATLDAHGSEENGLGLLDFGQWIDEGSLVAYFSPDA